MDLPLTDPGRQHQGQFSTRRRVGEISASSKPPTACGFRHKLKLTSDMFDLLVLYEGPATMRSKFWEFSH